MCAIWRDGFNAQMPAVELEKLKCVKPNGEIQFTEPGATDWLTVLSCSVRLAYTIPEYLASQIVCGAVFAAARQGPLSSKSILREISKREAKYERDPFESYILAANISIKHSPKLRPVRVNGCTIKFRSNFPSKFNRDKFLKTHQDVIGYKLPANYACVLVSTSGRSMVEAGERALDSLDLLRGIWNLRLNMQKAWRIQIGKAAPVNGIILGPLHSLHNSTGELIESPFWNETTYMGPIEPLDITGRLKTLKSFERRVWARMTTQLREEFIELIMNCLRRYARALDERDYEAAFLKLWSILERLTLTSPGDTYSVTIKRVSFLFKDSTLHKELLQHLRDQRNSAIHSGFFSSQGETLVFQIKRYVESLLIFHIFNRYRCDNTETLRQFLDLPQEIMALKDRYALVKSGLRFRSL